MGEVILPDFDYEQREPRQHSVVKETTVAVIPLNTPILKGKEIEFNVTESEHFTSLHETKLKLTCKVTKKAKAACDHANTDTTLKDRVAPINNVFHSMFSKVCVYINGHLAEMSDNYPYKAYLSTLMSYDKNVMDARGVLTGWSKDTAKHMDIAASDSTNAGSVARGASFASSKTVTMIGRLMSDMFMQGRSIPPQTKIRVVLYPALDSFVLMAPASKEYEMHIESAELLILRQQTPAALVQAYNTHTAKRNLKLNYRRTEVTSHNIKGSKKEEVTLFAQPAEVPDRILLGFVTNKAYAGQFEYNPFNFQHFDYQSIQISVDGQNYPNLPYTPDFGNTEDYLPLYDSFLREFNADNENHMINVTATEYANGYTLFPFRLVPRACCGDVLGEPLSGSVKLSLMKKAESTETLTLIVLSEYRSVYEISPVGGVSSEPKQQE
jgi:hypothetical protein